MHTLTDEQIDALGGRALDAVVAKHVMGWTNIHWTGSYVPWVKNVSGFLGAPFLIGYCRTDRGMAHAQVACYSTDIAAAWQVFERLDFFKGPFVLEYTPDKGYRVGVISTVGTLFNTTRDGSKIPYSATAPLAICRAALKAVRNAAH